MVLNQEVLSKYNEYYFKKYPRRSKIPIEHPYHESINKWFIMQRPQMNQLKQNWKEFICYWINTLGYQNMMLNCFEMTFTTYMPSKRRVDPDNTVPKFILDGFSESGFIVDDDGKHLKSLTLKTDYDKNDPRTEIEVKIIKDN
jgi:hypothetical protein